MRLVHLPSTSPTPAKRLHSKKRIAKDGNSIFCAIPWQGAPSNALRPGLMMQSVAYNFNGTGIAGTPQNGTIDVML
jgi:hypothetical protein